MPDDAPDADASEPAMCTFTTDELNAPEWYPTEATDRSGLTWGGADTPSVSGTPTA